MESSPSSKSEHADGPNFSGHGIARECSGDEVLHPRTSENEGKSSPGPLHMEKYLDPTTTVEDDPSSVAAYTFVNVLPRSTVPLPSNVSRSTHIPCIVLHDISTIYVLATRHEDGGHTPSGKSGMGKSIYSRTRSENTDGVMSSNDDNLTARAADGKVHTHGSLRSGKIFRHKNEAALPKVAACTACVFYNRVAWSGFS